MGTLRNSLLITLAVSLTSSAWAQSRSALQGGADRAVRQEVDAPFDPADPPPLHVDLDAGKGKVSRPVILRNVKPEGLASHMGTVIIETVIDEDGCVRQPKVVQGVDKEEGAIVLKTVRKWVFAPSTLDGKPVRVTYILTINAQPG